MKRIVHIRGERIAAVPPFIINDIKEHEIGGELYIKDMGFSPKTYCHCSECSEVTDYVLIYCVDGKGWVGTANRHYNIERDQILILPQNTPYTYGCDKNSPWSIYWIHFNGRKADFFSKGFDRPLNISKYSNSLIFEGINIFENIYAALCSGAEINNLLYAATAFFHFLGTLKFQSNCCECSQENVKTVSIADLAIHYMRENINRKITLADIAGYVGLSESYFSATFTKETGSSPMRYLAGIRLEQACYYLHTTNMKVNQICPLIGYDDSLYFSKTFSKTMGMSPSEYRISKKASA